jgi:flavin reductase (DIM6/NTAB) family NADH-FMN oxidoreductase RutF
MQPAKQDPSVPFDTSFFPVHVVLLSAGENLMPLGYWTVLSKNPFRFLISMGAGNHTLTLMKKHKEAALNFMPWSERDRIVRAGFLSGRDTDKAQVLGLELLPAAALKHTRIVKGADAVFETVVHMELMNLSREFSPFVLNVVHVHKAPNHLDHKPILFFGEEDFATTGERWKFDKRWTAPGRR